MTPEGGKVISIETRELRRENQQLRARIRHLEDVLERLTTQCLAALITNA